jgi:hypothetical protein
MKLKSSLLFLCQKHADKLSYSVTLNIQKRATNNLSSIVVAVVATQRKQVYRRDLALQICLKKSKSSLCKRMDSPQQVT